MQDKFFSQETAILAVETTYKADKNGGRQLYTNTLFTRVINPRFIIGKTYYNLKYSPFLWYCKN